MKNLIYINLLLLSFLSMSIISCSDDDSNGNEEIEKPVEINPMKAYTPLKSKPKSNKKDFLGSGYDYTGSYTNDYAARERVIDLDRFVTDHPLAYDQGKATMGSNYSMIGSNAWNYTKKLTNHANDYYRNPIPYSISAFSGTIIDNPMLNNRMENLKDFSFASVHFFFVTNLDRLFAFSHELHDYLSAEFKADLENLSSDKIIEKYGTHIITSYYTGLRLDMIYRSKIDISHYAIYDPEYNGRSEKEKCVEAGLRHTIDKIENWANEDVSIPLDKNLKMNGIPVLYIENHGGDNTLIPSGTYNLQKGYPKINISEWLKSVTDDNKALIGLELDRLIPIYELIKEVTKREELEKAINKYIEMRQIEL